MSSRVEDRDIRRLVIDLAGMHADDAAAVLGELDEAQRGTVQRLLDEFSGFAFLDGRKPEDFDAAMLSPWLAGRIAQEQALTDKTRGLLREIATELWPLPAKRQGRGAR